MELDIDEPIDSILRAQKLAYRYDLKPEEFYRLTYWELIVYVEAVQERRQNVADLQQEFDLIGAYLTVAYYVRAHTKSGLPSLSMELAKLRSGNDGELSPKASADAVRNWLGRSKNKVKENN